MQDACAITLVKENSCCMLPAETNEKECSSKEDNNNEDPAKGCAENPDCTTCPACYTFIFQPRYEWADNSLFLKSITLYSKRIIAHLIQAVRGSPRMDPSFTGKSFTKN